METEPVTKENASDARTTERLNDFRDLFRQAPVSIHLGDTNPHTVPRGPLPRTVAKFTGWNI